MPSYYVKYPNFIPSTLCGGFALVVFSRVGVNGCLIVCGRAPKKASVAGVGVTQRVGSYG